MRLHSGDEVDNYQRHTFRRTSPISSAASTPETELPEEKLIHQLIKSAIQRSYGEDLEWIEACSEEVGGFGWACWLLGIEPETARYLIARRRHKEVAE